MYQLEKIWQAVITWAENYLVPFIDTICLYKETLYHHEYHRPGWIRWYSVKSCQWGKWHVNETDWLDSNPENANPLCGRRPRRQKIQTVSTMPETAWVHCI